MAAFASGLQIDTAAHHLGAGREAVEHLLDACEARVAAMAASLEGKGRAELAQCETIPRVYRHTGRNVRAQGGGICQGHRGKVARLCKPTRLMLPCARPPLPPQQAPTTPAAYVAKALHPLEEFLTAQSATLPPGSRERREFVSRTVKPLSLTFKEVRAPLKPTCMCEARPT